ncbi:MAG: response regulator [Nitrospirae bacterium]|nr:response regulator [Nitrospirota bacterium]
MNDLRDKRILYVEDDEMIRKTVGQFLRRRCKEVLEAANGIEGIKIFMDSDPDIIVTDIEMPLMNGLYMIEKIMEVNKGKPIIITTAYNDLEHTSPHARATIIKPIKKELLIDALINCD